MSVRILHFADVHIDMVTSGKRDAASGFAIRTLDYLKAFDTIVDRAISERVDLVLFAGDAYRDAIPSPTFQREWDRRMMRLSAAKIPTLMIPGNHDITPTSTKADALQEFASFNIPYLHLGGERPKLWRPEDLDGVPIQVITIPWISRSKLVLGAHEANESQADQAAKLEVSLIQWIEPLLAGADPSLPLVVMAHYSVSGASFPNQQMITLGAEVTLPLKLLRDERITYTALGHIHKFQDLNEGNQPPVVYSGSIERVNFGESGEQKGFILAELRPGHADYEFIPLDGRRFYNREITIESQSTFMDEIYRALPNPDWAEGAMIRLAIRYPEEWEAELKPRELREWMKNAHEFHLIRLPIRSTRQRISSSVPINGLSKVDLLHKYFEAKGRKDAEIEALKDAAAPFFAAVQD